LLNEKVPCYFLYWPYPFQLLQNKNWEKWLDLNFFYLPFVSVLHSKGGFIVLNIGLLVWRRWNIHMSSWKCLMMNAICLVSHFLQLFFDYLVNLSSFICSVQWLSILHVSFL
jgi:hypothetical protein